MRWPERTKPKFATGLPPEALEFQGGVDCLCCLAVIFVEQVAVSFQRDRRRGMAEAVGNLHHIDASRDQLARVRVPQAMIRQIRKPDPASTSCPCGTKIIRVHWRTLDIGE